MSATEEMNESRRYSIDIDENFHKWIQEQRRNKTADKSSELTQSGTDDSFETLEKMCNKSVSDINSTLYKYLHPSNHQQILTDVNLHQKPVNDSSQLNSNTESK